MTKESLVKFGQELKDYAEKMKEIYTHCDSEEQTKVSMINPFIELLDYDVRDPRVVKFEFSVSPRGGGTRVDYALFCDKAQQGSTDTPTILIEAKSVSNDLAHVHILKQISDYADLVSSVEFVALTNGQTWKWFRKEKNSFGDRKLSQEPFLSHNTLTPLPVSSRELRFLKKISHKSFDPDSALEVADEVLFSDSILAFLEDVKEVPGDELRKLLFKRWGLQRNNRNIKLFEQVWPDCFESFIESQARKMQLDALLQETKDSENQKQPSNQTEDDSTQTTISDPSRSNERQAQNTTDTIQSFNTSEGDVSLDARSMKRAWKPSHEENWNIESNAKDLLLNVCRYLASIHRGGNEHFFSGAKNWFTLSNHLHEVSNPKSYKHVWGEYYLNTNLNNTSKIKVINELESLVLPNIEVTSGKPLIDSWLPSMPSRVDVRQQE